jgi:hypothetical protein
MALASRNRLVTAGSVEAPKCNLQQQLQEWRREMAARRGHTSSPSKSPAVASTSTSLLEANGDARSCGELGRTNDAAFQWPTFAEYDGVKHNGDTAAAPAEDIASLRHIVAKKLGCETSSDKRSSAAAAAAATGYSRASPSSAQASQGNSKEKGAMDRERRLLGVSSISQATSDASTAVPAGSGLHAGLTEAEEWEQRCHALQRDIQHEEAQAVELQDRIHWLRVQLRKQPDQNSSDMVAIEGLLAQMTDTAGIRS